MSEIFEDKHLRSYSISESADDKNDGTYAYEYSGCQSPVLKQLLEQTELQDLEFSGQDGSVFIHASVASVFSPVFKTAVLSSFKERKEKKIDVSPYTVSTLERFRDLIYKGLLVIRRSTVFDLLQFAHEYQVANMYSLCEKFLATRQNSDVSLFAGHPHGEVSDTNEKMKYYIKAFKCGVVYGSNSVKQSAEEELCAVVGGLATCPEFLKLDKKFILSLMLPACNAGDLLAALTAWLLFEGGRESSVVEILTKWGSTFLDFDKVCWPFVFANEFFKKNKKYENTIYEMLGRHYATRKCHCTSTEAAKNRTRTEPAKNRSHPKYILRVARNTFSSPSSVNSTPDGC